jgi:hypothetical protein
MKRVNIEQCSALRMTTGGEKKHPVVIHGGDKMQWVGFGWVNEGKASARDRKKYPRVTES